MTRETDKPTQHSLPKGKNVAGWAFAQDLGKWIVAKRKVGETAKAALARVTGDHSTPLSKEDQGSPLTVINAGRSLTTAGSQIAPKLSAIREPLVKWSGSLLPDVIQGGAAVGIGGAAGAVIRSPLISLLRVVKAGSQVITPVGWGALIGEIVLWGGEELIKHHVESTSNRPGVTTQGDDKLLELQDALLIELRHIMASAMEAHLHNVEEAHSENAMGSETVNVMKTMLTSAANTVATYGEEGLSKGLIHPDDATGEEWIEKFKFLAQGMVQAITQKVKDAVNKTIDNKRTMRLAEGNPSTTKEWGSIFTSYDEEREDKKVLFSEAPSGYTDDGVISPLDRFLEVSRGAASSHEAAEFQSTVLGLKTNTAFFKTAERTLTNDAIKSALEGEPGDKTVLGKMKKQINKDVRAAFTIEGKL